MYGCMYVYAYMLYQCLHLGMYIGRHMILCIIHRLTCIYVHTYTYYIHTCVCLEVYMYVGRMHVPSFVYVSHGCFLDNKVSCLCSGHWFFNDWANYQLNFISFYWASYIYDLRRWSYSFTIHFVPLWVIPIWFIPWGSVYSSTTKSMYTQWNHAVLCTMEPNTSPYIAFKGMYDAIYDIISDITDDIIKIEYWKVSHQMHHFRDFS